MILNTDVLVLGKKNSEIGGVDDELEIQRNIL